MQKKPILQVALDLLNKRRVLEIAKEAVEGGADWLEIGTPLIKAEGLEPLRELRRAHSKKTIVADMKTIDVGALEVEMASKAGANIVCIMGVSSDATIRDAIKAAKKYGTKIMIDLLGCEDKLKRALEVEKLGVDYLCFHVGIDEQMVGGNPLEELKRIAKKVRIPIAVAGGLNSETAPKVVSAGASIVIVGGAIIKSPDVKKATRIIKNAILKKKVVFSELYKKYDERNLMSAFLKTSSANISDAMHRKGAMHSLMAILNRGKKMVGRAVTVKTADGDWAKPVEAIDIADKNSVIVIDADDGKFAVWGELASWSCKMKGVSGVVIDGAVRDVDEILAMDFPVFAKRIVPSAGEPKGFGEINIEIVCAGQPVRPNDWIVGDESGVAVIPAEIATEIANRALDVYEKENRIRAEIKKGTTLSQVVELYKWEKVL